MGTQRKSSSVPAQISEASGVLSLPPLVSPAHAWHVLEWQSDRPLSMKEADWFSDVLSGTFLLAGLCTVLFSAALDQVQILLAHTNFSAPIHCELASWLCIHSIAERCNQYLSWEGNMSLSRCFSEGDLWKKQERLPASDWWNAVSPIAPAEARRYREQLLAQIKRKRYDQLGGCILRILRGKKEPGVFCAALVPVIAEAVWSHEPGIPMQELTRGLSLPLLTHRPQEALLQWLTSLSDLLSTSRALSEEHDMEHIMEIILQNPGLPYTQERLAHSLGLSPTYFCRAFHLKAGQPFSAFLTDVRMQRAKVLLMDDSLTLQEVSEQCGYPNKSYFCKVFRKYSGMSPGAYARQLRETPDAQIS
ncbi:MAG: helix-turn-helix transcriptional regulator [Clostridia bacterium]|nr:helix-turn-helix transcriptional regulator [Clostridia bacterium]